MVDIFKCIEKFLLSITNFLSLNYIFLIFVGLFLLIMIAVIVLTARSYEARLIKAIDKFNVYFIDNPQINEENLVAFNEKMKSNKVPKQLRKHWQQFVLYREDKASSYLSFENCVSNPIKNSTYTRDVKLMNIFAYIFSFCAFVLNCYFCLEELDVTLLFRNTLLTPIIILLLNYITQIILNLRHSAILSDLFQNYQYFEVNIDKATETLPEYVDYEVLFDRNEIKKGIPILYAYLQKRAEEEQRELERARLKNVEHEKFNFDDQGVAASLVLERAMQEAENYIAERKKYNQDIEQINADMTQEDMNYREITKEYNRQMQVSKETFANFKAQLEEASSTIEANYLKKQQQQELDRQRNLERDFDTATERHKKIIAGFHAELDEVDKFIEKSRKGLEDAMKSEFSSYSSKVYDEAKKLVEEREKDKTNKLKQNIVALEEKLVAKEQELESAYRENLSIGDKLEETSSALAAAQANDGKKSKGKKDNLRVPEPVVTKETIANLPVIEDDKPVAEQPKAYEPLKYEPLKYEPLKEDKDEDSGSSDNGTPDEGEAPLEYKPLTYEEKKDYYSEDKEESEKPVESEENKDDGQSSSIEDYLKDLEAVIGKNPSQEDKSTTQEEDEPITQESKTEQKDPSSQINDLFNEIFGSTKESDEEEQKESNQQSDEGEVLTKEKAKSIDDMFEELFGTSNNEQVEKEESSEDIGEEESSEIMDEIEDEELPEEEDFTDYSDSTNQGDDSIKKVPSRRGRPRKVVDETKIQGEKKRPGRPRKVVEETEVKPKGKVGRPKGSVKTNVKRPGRPRKVVEETSVKPKGKVGRPKGSVKTNVKRPGRPRKVVEETSVKPKGKVGRPKGSVKTNVKRPGRPTKEMLELLSKKPVGRPKKEQALPKPVKKGRGRPKKIQVANGIDEIDAYLQEIDNAIAAENAKLLQSEKALAKGAKIRRKK